jgi:hypothetical protein
MAPAVMGGHGHPIGLVFEFQCIDKEIVLDSSTVSETSLEDGDAFEEQSRSS